MRIWILLLNKVMRICYHWSTDPSWPHFDLYGTSRKCFCTILALFWASTAPEFRLWCGFGSGFWLDADPDSVFRSDADPQHWQRKTRSTRIIQIDHSLWRTTGAEESNLSPETRKTTSTNWGSTQGMHGSSVPPFHCLQQTRHLTEKVMYPSRNFRSDPRIWSCRNLNWRLCT